MIEYWKGVFGIQLLVRGHGSAVLKGMIPGLMAAVVYMGVVIYNDRQPEDFFAHPYAIGVYVGSIAFTIVFRMNNAYGRYWEACGSVFQMMSKFLDSTTHAGTYHLQQSHYEKAKPPSYYDHYNLNFMGLTRDRERGRRTGLHSMNSDPLAQNWEWDPNANLSNSEYKPKEKSINAVKGDGMFSDKSQRGSKTSQKKTSKAETALPVDTNLSPVKEDEGALETTSTKSSPRSALAGKAENFSDSYTIRPSPQDPGYQTASGHRFLQGRSRDDGNWSAITQGRPIPPGGFTPPVYLQELCHLSSLLVAVAFSTLRNDIEGAESPLDAYIPGQPWPEVDSDKMPSEVRHAFSPWVPLAKQLRYLLGMDKTAKVRTAYNASRPFLVLGGVSDGEIKMLQRARGAQAKTQLAWNWLSEFMIREHLAGSMGKVGPPIVSRCFQFLSDGMIPYHHARKIMFIPFPFPSAQLSVFFVINLIWAIPLMLTQYVNDPWLGAVVAFFAVTCFSGMHEVARELENPFKNVPNEIPLCTLLAQYNEALLTMYYGWNPDHFWNADDYTLPTDQSFQSKSVATSSEQASKPPFPSPVKSKIGKMQNGSVNNADPTTENKSSELQAMQDTIAQQSRELQELRDIIEKARRQGLTSSTSSGDATHNKTD